MHPFRFKPAYLVALALTFSAAVPAIAGITSYVLGEAVTLQAEAAHSARSS